MPLMPLSCGGRRISLRSAPRAMAAPEPEPSDTSCAHTDVSHPTKKRQRLKALPFVKHRRPEALQGAHKPLGLIATSAYVLTSAVQLSGAFVGPEWLPILAGGALGSLFIALNVAGVRHAWRAPDTPLRVIVVGGTKGVGKALAREFLRCGDVVLVTSRSQADADHAARTLLQEAGLPAESDAAVGVACDVCSPASIEALKDTAREQLGQVDCWINNAGYSGSFQVRSALGGTCKDTPHENSPCFELQGCCPSSSASSTLSLRHGPDVIEQHKLGHYGRDAHA